jgi:isoleucyl-tRNA synthetase
MSSFYLDIIKDRLYANAPNDPARKASQTVMYDALLAITTLISPILPHTADEVWKYIPGVELLSVQLAEMPKADAGLYDQALEAKWDRFLDVRDEVLKALEEARQSKVIGNSLGAAVHLYPNAETAELLGALDQLDQLFIVSQVHVHKPGEAAPEGALRGKHLDVQVVQAEGEKCERCWIVTPEVGHSKEHPTLCVRCNSVVEAHYAG